ELREPRKPINPHIPPIFGLLFDIFARYCLFFVFYTKSARPFIFLIFELGLTYDLLTPVQKIRSQ
ncbi:MAG TPA: hypothetical protein DCX37_04060, partial [Firmicutes bacterium]|nr:hypothetical protein [Bacillota bacterium]